jgi:hypothetical protein
VCVRHSLESDQLLHFGANVAIPADHLWLLDHPEESAKMGEFGRTRPSSQIEATDQR